MTLSLCVHRGHGLKQRLTGSVLDEDEEVPSSDDDDFVIEDFEAI